MICLQVITTIAAAPVVAHFPVVRRRRIVVVKFALRVVEGVQVDGDDLDELVRTETVWYDVRHQVA